jgi:ABC-type nitrate/sulfonate/bicarbonate transport system substrate-binding protein
MSKSTQKIEKIWFTRCPVPTATGLAYKLGWLGEEFAKDGIAIQTLQETPELNRHHYDHELPELIREGGNLLAIPARAQGAPTRLIGLTWIDEWQTILVRPGSDISEPRHLKGKRAALPAFREEDLRNNTRGRSIARGMSLHGYKGALASAGLTLDDIELVEVPSEPRGNGGSGVQRLWTGLEYLIDGKVDAVYVKGAAAVDAAKKYGAVVGINLDLLPDKRFRVNNGTPRPITAHESLIENHFDLVVRFLDQTLRAADWAKHNLGGVRSILESETRGGAEGVVTAYGENFHLSLHPDLSKERLELFRQQKNFLLVHGILDRDFDFDAWVDPRPLEAAQALQAARLAQGKAKIENSAEQAQAVAP